MDTILMPKNADKIYCKICDDICCKGCKYEAYIC